MSASSIFVGVCGASVMRTCNIGRGAGGAEGRVYVVSVSIVIRAVTSFAVPCESLISRLN